MNKPARKAGEMTPLLRSTRAKSLQGVRNPALWDVFFNGIGQKRTIRISM